MAGEGQVIFEDIAPLAQQALPMAGPWGAAASAGIGLGQTLYGMKKGGDATPPSLYDPRIMNQISDLERRRANLGTGASFSNAMRDAMTQRGAGLQALARSGNLNQYGLLDRISAGNINKALADMQDKEFAYTQAIGAMEKDQSNRRYSLDMQQYAEDKATAEKMKKSGLQNILAGATYGLGGGMKPPSVGGVDPNTVTGATSASKTGVQNFQFNPSVAPTTTWDGGSGGTQAPTMATPPIVNPEAGLGGLLYSDPTKLIPGVNASTGFSGLASLLAN